MRRFGANGAGEHGDRPDRVPRHRGGAQFVEVMVHYPAYDLLDRYAKRIEHPCLKSTKVVLSKCDLVLELYFHPGVDPSWFDCWRIKQDINAYFRDQLGDQVPKSNGSYFDCVGWRVERSVFLQSAHLCWTIQPEPRKPALPPIRAIGWAGESTQGTPTMATGFVEAP